MDGSSQAMLSNPALLVVLIPLVFAVLIFFLGEKRSGLGSLFGVIASVATFAVTISMMKTVIGGGVYEVSLGEVVPGINFALRVDQLGLLLVFTAALIWVLATIHSIGYMSHSHSKRRYFSFVALCLSWTVGVAISANLFTYLIFYELFSFSTYPLIVHEETPEALAAGKKYMIYILIGSSFVLFSIIYTYFLAGTLDLSMAGIPTLAAQNRTALLVLFWGFMIGFGVKAAMMPLHGWVPQAHPVAPAPFSAILSGVMVAVGAFGILRTVLNVFGVALIKSLNVSLTLAYIVSFTIIVSSILALNQDNIKRRLAYSTIGQMGYIVLGTVLLTEFSVAGALVHIINHALMKGTLFMCAGNIIHQSGKIKVSEMKGLGNKMPLTFIAFTIAALGMIGLPPFAGFISKWYLAVGALDANGVFFVIVLLISSLLGGAYFLPVIYTAFFQKAEGEAAAGHGHDEHGHGEAAKVESIEAPAVMTIPVLVGALGVIALGIFAKAPNFPLDIIKAATNILLK